MARTFVGFGLGAIQAGLFLREAQAAGCFDRLVVAEVVPTVVESVRAAGGCIALNIAGPDGLERHTLTGVEVLNPNVPVEAERLVAAVADATELATALPSVDFYGQGRPGEVTAVLAAGLRRKGATGPRAVLYAAENHNHAAERLEARLTELLGEPPARLQCLNTVIGKMCSVVVDPREIADQGLLPMTPGAARAVRVEAFNRILVTAIRWPDFNRGIRVFEEKADLLPFEEAKLYGHNATHALLGYFAALLGLRWMSEIADHPALVEYGRAAFLEESGAALCRTYAGLDRLFTPDGFRDYAEDLMTRMLNPHLRDAVERVTRDPARKLAWEDRLVGTLRLVRRCGGEGDRFAAAAAAALRMWVGPEGRRDAARLIALWSAGGAPAEPCVEMACRILEADGRLDAQLEAFGPLRAGMGGAG